MDDLGKRIRDYRLLKNLTQTRLADLLGINQSSYSRLEMKGDRTTIEQLRLLAKAFEVSEFELLGYVNKPEDLDLVKKKEAEISKLKELIDLGKRENDIAKKELTMLEKEIEDLKHQNEVLRTIILEAVGKEQLTKLYQDINQKLLLSKLLKK